MKYVQYGMKTVFITVLFAVVLVLISGSREASAHATLEHMTPKEDQVVSSAPNKIELKFNEPVDADHSAIALYNDNGDVIEHLKPTEAGSSNVLTFSPQHLHKGTHQLKWHAISADGHEVGSTYNFSVGQRTAHHIDTSLPFYQKVSFWFGLVRYVTEALMILSVGYYLVNKLAERRGLKVYQILPHHQAVIWSIIILIIITGLLYLFTLSNDIRKDILSLDKATLLQTPFIITSVALIILFFLWTLNRMTEIWYTLIPSTIIIVLSMSGHAWSQHLVWWSLFIRVIHIGGIALWLGALIYLIVDYFQDTHHSMVRTTRRFLLQTNLIAVLMIIISGILMMVDETHISILWSEFHTWTILVVVKMIGTALMMLLGYYQTIHALKHQGRARLLPLMSELSIGVLLVLLGVVMSQISIPA
ncbi:copper resistance protein CopC [Staphylococcus sp. SQ8-PEA]|uniref:Copper resistance protein CopC n=1 Tax=Staphylococcus marylandisciuri TaxID=2981529 RepID=A0ABT2QMS8_9STAP|nr:copper resistance protein CopC [Staphylococcus marylandisciuri]MCU5745275.1 copper resistance protein CopC [Staphylococcus marylandisciuri]